MNMSSLIPEKKDGTSRWDLLQVWGALNWLEKNNRAAFKDAAKAIGLTEKDLQDSVRFLGYEVGLWNEKQPYYKPAAEEVETSEDLNY